MCFINYIKAGYPIMWVKTHEETRVLTDYAHQISSLKVNEGETPYTAFGWDVADGIRQLSLKGGALASGKPIDGTAQDPMAPLVWLDEQAPDNTILFLKDYRPFMQKEFGDSTLINRKIRNLISKFRSQGKVLVIMSPDVQIPSELDKEINVINYKLPGRDELKIVLKSACEASEAPYPTNDEEIINAALGMTASEAENTYSISLVETKMFDPKVIRREKSMIVKKTGLLEVIESGYTMDDIGGLENLKEWLGGRMNCFGSVAKAYGITPPKGLLLAGVPGTGKSLSAKAVASMWGRPLLRFDMGRIMGGIVGESESNMRKCLEIAAAVAPCVLWIDEIEKGLSGVKAGANQQKAHEVTERVFGELLNFMQDRQADVFLVATCNSLDSLPPELLRSGRIDSIFWVDLPDEVQREEIIKIHLKRRGRKPGMFDSVMPQLIKVSDTFTGAEIEVWLQESLIRAFNAGHKDVQLEDFLATADEITPIAQLMKTDIETSRAAAKARGTKQASKVHEGIKVPAAPTAPRKIKMI
jgi:ATP-dependent 26S proteasome regulatory subunit